MSMANDEVVMGVLAKVAGVERAAVKPESELAADLDIDSAKALELLVALEDELGIEISDESYVDMHTAADVVRCVSVQSPPAA